MLIIACCQRWHQDNGHIFCYILILNKIFWEQCMSLWHTLTRVIPFHSFFGNAIYKCHSQARLKTKEMHRNCQGLWSVSSMHRYNTLPIHNFHYHYCGPHLKWCGLIFVSFPGALLTFFPLHHNVCQSILKCKKYVLKHSYKSPS